MSAPPIVRVHTDAVIAALEAAGLTVGDADAAGLAPPYAVVYHINDTFSGTLEDAYEDADMVYQVTSVGTTREQAEWVQDKAMVLLGGFDVEGRFISNVRPDSGPGVRPDRDVTPHVFFSTPRFTIKTTPNTSEVSA